MCSFTWFLMQTPFAPITHSPPAFPILPPSPSPSLISLCHNPSIWAWWCPGSFLSSLGLFCQRGWFGPLSCHMLPSTSLHPNGAVRRGSAEPAQLVWRLKDSSHVPPKKGSGRTCWQSRASKPFLITDSARSVLTHAHTHTMALVNLEARAVERFYRASSLHKWAYSLVKLAYSLRI